VAAVATGWVWHERYMWHDTGNGGGPLPAGGWIEPMPHIEGPDAKRRFANLVAASGLLAHLRSVDPEPAAAEDVLRVHTTEHVERIRRDAGSGGGDAGDGSSPFGRDSYDIALLAAGGAIAAVRAVIQESVDNAYALVRPPGHHAMPGDGHGFCIFNNVAVAARHAQATLGATRVAIVDWDAHHGNGTQSIFWEDPTVLTISVHQDGAFPPGSGSLTENGVGPGAGTTLNIPLPPGSGAGAYEAAFTTVVAPALMRFRPEVIIVASGLDAAGMDPLARLMLHSSAYRWLTRCLMDVADSVCDGRIAMVHEGGYSPFAAPFCGLAIVETLARVRTEVEDPFLASIQSYGQALLPHQEEAVRGARDLVGCVPR
jgi:acetoin utilization deacetylase AcuC-like enzyme